jgi:type IV secretory pathway VirB6-like protein
MAVATEAACAQKHGPIKPRAIANTVQSSRQQAKTKARPRAGKNKSQAASKAKTYLTH